MVTMSGHVQLRNSGTGSWAAIREVTGFDEEAVSSTGTPAAIALIDRLLLPVPGTKIRPGSAASLTAADRDLVLAAVHVQVSGPLVRSALTCTGCREIFDLDFNLPDLLARLRQANEQTQVRTLANGVFELESGVRFRLPTGEEECALIGMPQVEGVQWILERCVVDGEAGLAGEQAQLAMEQVAPVADVDLAAECPECGANERVHFDLQHYLLSGFMAERRTLATEVHLLARGYGWSRHEIMEMPRSQRKSAVSMVTGAEPARWGY
ncbi:MAG: hypothetical protein WD208_13525 [Dehalococcoidia bacterium]